MRGLKLVECEAMACLIDASVIDVQLVDVKGVVDMMARAGSCLSARSHSEAWFKRSMDELL